MQRMPFDDTKSTVIQSLQASLTVETSRGPIERAPGSRYSIGIERAIDYAVSPRRREPQAAFLKHDVLRNAQLAIRRATMSEARTVATIAAISAPPHRAFNGRLQTGSRVSDECREQSGVHTSGPGWARGWHHDGGIDDS